MDFFNGFIRECPALDDTSNLSHTLSLQNMLKITDTHFFLQEMEFSEGIGIRDLTVNNNEVLVSWKWAWEDSPPYPKVIQIPGLNHHQCEEDEPAEGEALDT